MGQVMESKLWPFSLYEISIKEEKKVSFWLRRRKRENASEKTYFVRPQRPLRFRTIPPLLFPALYALPAIIGVGAGLAFLSTRQINGTTMSTSAFANPNTTISIKETNENNPTLMNSATSNQMATNENNDGDMNTSDSDNTIMNTGNTVEVNNNRRRRRSLNYLLWALRATARKQSKLIR